MSNSSLVNVKILSPNYNTRQQPISKITVHHMAGVLSVESCGNTFASPARQASSNYGIDSNGRVGLYVEEKNRPWTSSSSWNDHRAVTIEVSNSASGEPWPISDKAWDKLIELCVDICKRNGMKELTWTGDKNGSLTCHYMFAATGCPGTTLKGRMAELAKIVTARLKGTTPAPSTPSTPAKPATPAAKTHKNIWDKDFTLALQKHFGTKQDGIISEQDSIDFNAINDGGLSRSTFDLGGGKNGSQVIKKVQTVLGVRADGKCGRITITAWQKRMGATNPDGKVSNPSKMIEATWKRLDQGKF